MRRPDSWASVFMEVARAVSRRSKDPSFQAGAVVVGKGQRVLGLGFNGPPPQIDDGLVPWETREGKFTKYDTIIHAEENALLDALDKNPAERLTGATVYVTGHSCPGCVLRMVRAGVAWIVWDDTGSQPRMVDDSARERCHAILAALKPLLRPVKLIPYSEVEPQ